MWLLLLLGTLECSMLKTDKVTVRLPASLKAALEARAKAEQETPAEIHRRALAAFLGPPRKPQHSD